MLAGKRKASILDPRTRAVRRTLPGIQQISRYDTFFQENMCYFSGLGECNTDLLQVFAHFLEAHVKLIDKLNHS
jgi:hypothetical protein